MSRRRRQQRKRMRQWFVGENMFGDRYWRRWNPRFQSWTATNENSVRIKRQDRVLSHTDIRLEGVENPIGVQLTDLAQPRRAEDRQNDLFTVVNVLQENALRYGLRYGVNSINNRGREVIRHMHSRPVIDTTATAVEMTGSIWEAAARLLK